MVKYFDDGAHGNRIYYSAEGYIKPCPFLHDKYVSRTRQSYRLYPLPFEEMESSSQKLSETSKKIIDDLLSTYERARGIVNSVCLRVFSEFFICQSRLRFIDSIEELDRIWYGSKEEITKEGLWFINARVTCIAAYHVCDSSFVTKRKNSEQKGLDLEENFIWKIIS